MGYTHYFEQKREFSAKEWMDLAFDANQLFEASPVRLGNGLGEPGSVPEIADEYIRFNGVEPDDYETFEIRAEGGGGFCKTGFSEICRYDLIVKAVLIAAYNTAPDAIEVSSDGFDFEWEDALAFANENIPGSLRMPPSIRRNAGFTPEYRSGELYEQVKAEYIQNKASRR